MEYQRSIERSRTRVWVEVSGGEEHGAARERQKEIQRTVRDAIALLAPIEREIIEGYYFEGLSLQRLANRAGRPFSRMRMLHERALRKLAMILAPFVERVFRIRVLQFPNCPICRAEWRSDAERILDDKTDDVTWGAIIRRIERATGWRAPGAPVLKAHQARHRAFTKFHGDEREESHAE